MGIIRAGTMVEYYRLSKTAKIDKNAAFHPESLLSHILLFTFSFNFYKVELKIN